MFGQDTNQTVMGSPTVQNPSMLDNVPAPAPSFQASTNPVSTPQHAPQPTPFAAPLPPAPYTPAPSPPPAPAAPEHPLTSDNPFIQTAAASPMQGAGPASPSGPVTPPAPPVPNTTDDQTGYIAALTDDSSTAAPVDQDKLADMKQQALQHLEPLADHLDGTPEETFKTTMMMIQANDNHTLLDKALDAAKKIEDDRARAQAMLDIINEINYFSQRG